MKNNNFFLFEKAKRQKTSRPRGRSSNNGGKREANFLGNKIKIFTKKERKGRKTVEKRVRETHPPPISASHSFLNRVSVVCA